MTFGKADFFSIGTFKDGKLEGQGSFFNGTIFLKGKFSKNILIEGNIYCVSELEESCESAMESYLENPKNKFKGPLLVSKLPRN